MNGKNIFSGEYLSPFFVFFPKFCQKIEKQNMDSLASYKRSEKVLTTNNFGISEKKFFLIVIQSFTDTIG